MNNQIEKLDYELRFILAITRNLPQLRGMIRLGKIFCDLYLRKVHSNITIDVLGFKMRLAPHESFSNSACLFFPQLYDYREVRFLRKNLKPGDIFIDIGAHIGFYSLIASQLVGESGKVLAVEADPHTYQQLTDNLQLNNIQNIAYFNYGVSEKIETLELVIDTRQRGKSSFLRQEGEKIAIQCYPLEEIIKKAGLNGQKIKGIKIDIEGFEYKAIKPYLQNSDKKNLPDFFLVEYNKEVYQNKLADLLKVKGYVLHKKIGSNRIYIKKLYEQKN